MPEQSSPETAEMDQEPGPPASAVVLASDAEAPEDPPSQLDDFKNRVQLLCDSDKADFDAWVSLIRSAEETSSDDIEVISLVYHSFLLEFPLCYGYWIKYAAHKARLCTNEHVVEVYEQAVQAVPHSVDLWVSYCDFGVCSYEDPAAIRSLFERALSLVGKDYLCYHLWDKYIEFENSQKQLVQLATIYINTLKFPTKKLHEYYESFRKLVTLLEEEVNHCIAERLSESIYTSEVVEDAENSELDITTVISDLFDQIGGQLRPEALKQYLSVGERLYQRSSKFYKDICCFEASIKRRFFHFKPLDDPQLGNWHQYLDYVEKNGDFDWVVKLYERCLIPCANYSEFWIRYAEYVDAKGGREIANYALGRASSCFVKGVPTFCMYYAMFKEKIGDASAARSLFVKARSNFTSGYYANINRLANMEKRMGNTKAAYEIYETAIEDAMQRQNIEILPDLYSNFAQFVYVVSRSIREAKEVFDKGIKRAPCKPLIKGLIQFMSTHGGPTEIPLLDSVISNAVTPGSDIYTTLSPEDREDISLLFLEFVDLYGGVEELKKAWARHSKLFPQSTRNVPQQYCSTGNGLHEDNKRRKTEPMMVAHDNSLEDIRKLEQSSKPDNYSLIVDKEVDSQGDRNVVDSGIGHKDAEEKKALGNLDLHHEASRTAHECTEMVHGPHVPDNFGMQNQINSHAKEVVDQDLGSCKQNGEKTNFHQDQGEEAPVAESGGRDSPSIAIACSEKINSQEKAIEVSPSSHPEILCSKSGSTSGASIPKEGRPSDPPQVSPELEERQPVKVQVEVDMKNDLSVNNPNTERFDDGQNQTQYAHKSQDHIQSSQPQQLPVCAKSSSSELAKTEMSTLRCEAQPKQEVANSQAPQFNNHSLAGQNMQQQWLSYTMPQNVQTPSQTQDQLIAQPNQGNQQYLQMTQGYASQMWQYYQQQMLYLQAQHNQQMQSLQQQQLPTEQLQQNFMQQVQQLNQQMVLWQQQVQQQQQQQQQLQQALPVQQQPDNKQGQSSSGDTKTKPNKHQQQSSQMDNQSQQLQQQQLLYFQQQQQQMYLMQQQQMYQQQQNQQQQQQLLQQQLMQQQYLLQRPQQQQDSVQHQQLFEQQQQQMLLLQQQQQQFIQQQMQQYAQQQQTQQGPKDQSYKLNPQGRRNPQMEHGQRSETSQSDGSKRRSREQSELSYPSTPQSQRSIH